MKILVFPKDKNPYQELLYTEMRKRGDVVNYLSYSTSSATINSLTLIPRIIFCRLQGYTIFHLHWIYAFSPRARVWRMKLFNNLAYLHYLFCLKIVKLLNYKLVWTAHNALPHESLFSNDIVARRKLIGSADLVIAHSAATIEELKKIGAEPKRLIIIPHGSYIGIYPNTITRNAAREKLGLQPDVFVYLYLGQVREYKGVDNLLDAYEKMRTEESALIIAGEGSKIGHVNDNELQIYFNAADVVVLPFKKITTSGSALLAFSFGKAVIVPRLGDLANLPHEIAYKYSPDESDGLVNAMKQAKNNVEILHKKSRAALEYAKQLSWPSIAKQTHDAMRELFSDR